MHRSSSSAVLLALVGVAHAEPRTAGLDATLSEPLQPWRDTAGAGGGGSLWLRDPITPLVDVTIRLGAIVHADRSVADVPSARQRLSEVPLVGGARYRLTDGTVRGYLEAEVGFVFARTDVDVAGLADSSSPIRLASELGAAIEIDRFELRVGIWLADLSDLDHSIGVIASLGGRLISF
jgi:hypothetical protein